MGEHSSWEVSRRTFLGGAATVVAAAAWGTPPATAGVRRVTNPQVPDGVFSLGVASGDPHPDSVVLWTRLAPDPLNGGGMPEVNVPVQYEVAEDDAFGRVVRSGQVRARPKYAHSVHVVAGGLEPDAWYWYRFRVGDQLSPVGRTRTAPARGRGDSLRFLFASCQNWPAGFFTAWQHAPEEDPDLVVHLGDYIYEGGRGSGVRQHNSDEVRTLDAYRNRYALYKGDPALQAIHATCPWIVTWDDHEVENNYAGLLPENPAEAPAFAARRAAAYQAWWEHQPVRMAPPVDETLRIYRNVVWGNLAKFHVLDSRQYRSDQPCGSSNDFGSPCPERLDPTHTLLGDEQEQWLGRSLARSPATWDVLANQVVMTSMPVAGLLSFDQWDGYPAARTRLFDSLAAAGTQNPVVITGDIHASGVGDVVDEAPGSPALATELVGTSISSGFFTDAVAAAEQLIGALPYVRWVNARKRGYVRCDVSAETLVAQYRLVDTVATPTSPISTERTFTVEAGTIGAHE